MPNPKPFLLCDVDTSLSRVAHSDRESIPLGLLRNALMHDTTFDCAPEDNAHLWHRRELTWACESCSSGKWEKCDDTNPVAPTDALS